MTAAGRDLDAEISRVVFETPTQTDYAGTVWEEDGGIVPFYSQSIQAAWLVVDRMRELDRYHGFCSALHDGLDADRSDDLGWLLLERPGPEVARLLCVAALAAFAHPSVLDLGGAARMNAAAADGQR